MTLWTPGPWAYRPGKYDDWGIVRGPDGFRVAKAEAGRDIGEDEEQRHRRARSDPYEANARLIAAAPTMAAYLQRCAACGDDEAAAILGAIHAPRAFLNTDWTERARIAAAVRGPADLADADAFLRALARAGLPVQDLGATNIDAVFDELRANMTEEPA